MRKLIVVAAFMLCGCATANPDYGNASTMAHRLAELQNTEDMTRVSGRAYVDEYLARIPDFNDFCETAADVDGCQAIAQRFLGEVDLILDKSVDEMQGLREKLIEDDASVIEDLYTIDEMRAAIAFFETPAGRSTQAKASQIAAARTAARYNRLRPWTEKLTAEVATLYSGYTSSFQSAFEDN